MKLNNMLDELLDLVKQENEPNRYAHSEEYNKLYDELDRKTLIIDELEEKLGCPLELYIKLVRNIPLYDSNGDRWFNRGIVIKDNSRGIFAVRKVEVCGELRSYYNYFKLSDYKNNWWLKEDRSE